MEERDRLLIEKHIEHDQELKKFVAEHELFEQQLDELNAKHYLSTEEEMQIKKLKKLKLAGRDRIELILKKYR